jgi:hypothetical protein
MSRSSPSRLALGFALAGLATACAPRMANNHYQRWTAYEEAAKAEAAAEEAAAARIEANASGGKAAAPKGADVKAVARTGQTTADMANGPVQRISPYLDTVKLLESLGSKNSNKCVSC